MNKEVDIFSTVDELESYLRSFGLSLEQWGQGNTKSVEKLWAEIQKGDCLVQEIDGKLVRVTWPIFVQVRYSNNGIAYEMFEEKQQFRDGRTRTRTLPGSIGEKGKYGEDPDEAANRAIAEELREIPLSLEGAELTFIRQWSELEDARSYPGLTTFSDNRIFAFTLTPNQGEPQPFSLDEDGDISFFNWRVLDNLETEL